MDGYGIFSLSVSPSAKQARNTQSFLDDWQRNYYGNETWERPAYLAAFIAPDGYIYVVNHAEFDTMRGRVLGTDSTTYYPCPKLVFRAAVGPSIATPLIVGNKIIAAIYVRIPIFLLFFL